MGWGGRRRIWGSLGLSPGKEGGKQSSPTEYTGGNSRKLIANKPPMRGGGVINITEPYEGGRGKIGRFYNNNNNNNNKDFIYRGGHVTAEKLTNLWPSN